MERVLKIGGRDDDGVDVLAIVKLFVIATQRRRRATSFCTPAEPCSRRRLQMSDSAVKSKFCSFAFL